MATSSYDETGAGGGDDDYKSQMSSADLVKLELLQGLLAKNINLTNEELSELTGFDVEQIENIRNRVHRSTLDQSQAPLSWDYVLVFNVGDKEKRKKPSKKDVKGRDGDDNAEEWKDGMSQDKYFGQIYNKIWKKLEESDKPRCPRLTVEAFKSQDKAFMYLVVGITEANLKYWADERDTDLLIDPVGGVKVGRKKGFALAMRTKLTTDKHEEDTGDEDQPEEKVDETIDLSNWAYLYAEYNQGAPQSIYKSYKRTDSPDSVDTVFDEKTRLRIIYETLIADTNEGGAEIKIEDFIKSKNHPLMACFPLADDKVLAVFEETWIKNWNPMWLTWCPLEEVRAYFGEPVAFYFGFLHFYIKWLIAPAVIGTIFICIQIGLNEVAITPIPLMCIFIIFWCVAFVDFWLRQEARFRLMWGMTKFETKAVARPQFNGEWAHDAVTGLWTEEFSLMKRAFRMTSIFSGILLFLFMCIAAVVSVLVVRDGDPNDLVLKLLLGVANGVMIFVFDAIYKLMSGYGNDWENHRTDQDYQNALISKNFFFKFFNSFASLFYLGFVRPAYKGDEYYLRYYDAVCSKAGDYMSEFLDGPLYDTSLGKYDDYEDYIDICNGDPDKCITKVDDDDLWAVVRDGYKPDPSLGNKKKCPTGIDYNKKRDSCPGQCDNIEIQLEMNEAVLGELRLQLLSLFMTAIVIQNTLEVLVPIIMEKVRKDKAAKAAAEKGEDEERPEVEVQQGKDAYVDTIDDMSEMIVQFGYVTLFVMAFPVTPLLAFINNVIEMKVDATNLVKTSQRPHPNGSNGLGSWNAVLGFFSIVSVITNVALITWRTKLVSEMFAENVTYKWIFFTALASILMLAVAAEKALIPDVPIPVEQGIERQRLVESVLVLGANTDNTSTQAPDLDDDDGPIKFDPNAEFIDVETLPDVPRKNLKYFGKEA